MLSTLPPPPTVMLRQVRSKQCWCHMGHSGAYLLLVGICFSRCPTRLEACCFHAGLVQVAQHCADEDGAGGRDGDEEGGEEAKEEAALDALLDNAAGMVGGRSRKRVRFEEPASGSESDDEGGDGAGAMYADFFGSRGAP